MRSFLLWACMLCLLGQANATTYYFSSSTGNDSRSASEASDPSTPWKSIAKLNSFFSSLKPGDVVLFKRGDTFFGTIKATKSGTGSAPITFGAYGSGDKPQITGFVTLTNWVSVGGGKYESTNSSLASSLNVVSFNGANQHMGRFPNADAPNGGYLNFESHGANYINDNELTSATNWKGAELVVRTHRPVLDRVKIIDHSSTRLYYSPALTYEPENNFGYFVQHDVRTLDQTGEWYYNARAKKLTMYFGSTSPSSATVQASALANVLYVYGHDYLVFDNLAFTGANEDAIYLYSAENIVIRNSDVSFSNTQAIWASNTRKLLLENNTINHTHNIGVNLSGGTYAVVRGNTVSNTALLGGMGQSGANQGVGIREAGSNHTIEGNTVENIGYHGIRFAGNYALIKNNLVSNFNLTRDDGGGIYTWTSPLMPVPVGQKVIGNTIINGTGAAAGTSWEVAASTSGIYLDSYSSNIEVANNTVANTNSRGIFLHNTSNVNVHDNLVYDNLIALHIGYDIPIVLRPLRNNTIKNNIFFAKKASQTLLSFKTLSEGIEKKATFDNNYYCRPLDDGYYIKNSFLNAFGTRIDQTLDLESWQKIYKEDLKSKGSVTQIIPHTLDALLGSNRFTNGTFNSNISGMNGYSSAPFTRAWVNSKLDGGTFQGTISSSNPSIYTASVPVGAVTAGKKYVIHFTAQSSRDTSMNVFLRTTSSPLRVISNDGTKTVTRISASRKDYEYAFTPTQSENNAVLFFELHGRNHSFWLDNIKVHEADVTMTNPDDSIRFVSNPTASSKRVSLNGTYVDARNRTYTNSITLAPYTSAALIKKAGGGTAEPQAPLVNLTSPTADASFAAPASVQLAATAKDEDGSISKVEFYNGSKLITTQTTAPYEWTWPEVAAGTYTVTAKAYDNDGNETTSEPVTFTVEEARNAAPVVRLTSPTTEATYTEGSSVQLTAEASDEDGKINRVEFYEGKNLITTQKAAPYSFEWVNVPAGTYAITAKAFDNRGEETTSREVTITVVPEKIIAPVVRLTSPTADATHTEGASVQLKAEASDEDGSISRVEFYNGSTLLATEENAPYAFNWSDVPVGTYTITARAYDNDENETTSEPVTFTVEEIKNSAPAVRLTSPRANISYTAPASVRIMANASDEDGSISKVEFYNGSTLLATEKVVPYDWRWTNVPAGTYTITAKAYDNNGKATTSEEVTITVEEKKNSAPVVRMVTPKNNATYQQGVTVQLSAEAFDEDGTINRVEFYAYDSLLDVETSAPYRWTVEDVPAGVYVLKVKAYDDSGNEAVSEAITVTVLERGKSRSAVSASATNGSRLALAETDKAGKATTFDYSLYPNPASSKIRLQFTEVQSNQKVNVMIRNTAGALVISRAATLSGRTLEVDISTLTPGAYILSVAGQDVSGSKNFIKTN